MLKFTHTRQLNQDIFVFDSLWEESIATGICYQWGLQFSQAFCLVHCGDKWAGLGYKDELQEHTEVGAAMAFHKL